MTEGCDQAKIAAEAAGRARDPIRAAICTRPEPGLRAASWYCESVTSHEYAR
jgi:hypothetical protein